MNLSLFPKNEDWGTGDEALDSRLNARFKKTSQNLSLEAIFDFYSFALNLKTRVYNPAFQLTIDQVVKALLFYLDPHSCNDVLFKRMRGQWSDKEKISFHLNEAPQLLSELKSKQRVRYKDQLDFSFIEHTNAERNPFVTEAIKRSPKEMQAKILFKELRFFLEGEQVKDNFSDPLFLALKGGKTVLVIEGFAELWFYQGLLFSNSFFKCQRYFSP